MKHFKQDYSELETKFKVKFGDPEEICDQWNELFKANICVCQIAQAGMVSAADAITQTWALAGKYHGLDIDI